MESIETQTLIRLGQPRFRNFSDAVEPILSAIADAVPGLIVLGRLEPDEPGCRVIEVQGTGLSGIAKGTFLPLGAANSAAPQHCDQDPLPQLKLDSEYLESCSLCGRIWEMPLEVSDGRIVGILAALDSRCRCLRRGPSGATRHRGAAAWAMNGRALSSGPSSDGFAKAPLADAKIDTDTGLPSRDSFLGLLDHEWELTNRGTVESVLVAFRIGEDPDRGSQSRSTEQAGDKDRRGGTGGKRQDDGSPRTHRRGDRCRDPGWLSRRACV